MKNETLYVYPRQLINGIWLVIAGISTLTLLIPLRTSSGVIPNPILFIIIYSLGMFWQLNKRTRNKYALHKGTKKQNTWSNIGLLLLTAMIVLATIPLVGQKVVFASQIILTWKMVFLAVSVHFLAFIPVHGKIMLVLSILTVSNVLINYFFMLPINQLFVIDGLFKITLGIVTIKISPTNF
ncbi:DUF6609 family protein [Enterococcus sp. AZ196]|uniref:DUF6609 family protein n=1 Tax=Enterococcus sp. AZ196 TaxID=2774659 RepID=UPI003D2CE632